MHNYSMV